MGRMRRFLFAGAILLPALVLFSSCGDDGDDDTPKSGGTDEEYLAAICKGTSDFSNALLTKTTAAEIGNVIEDFITLMKDANPPADLADYNQEFVKYLEDAVAVDDVAANTAIIDAVKVAKPIPTVPAQRRRPNILCIRTIPENPVA